MHDTGSSLPQPQINTPDELLAIAERYFASNDPTMMRAAVLEAMAALETFVQKKVFAALEGKLDPLLRKWLEEKTKMDFDSRLRVLAPVAMGRPVDTRDKLWQNYQEARGIRNRVTHAGIRVTQERARFVIDTVYRWLAFLGSSVELQVALVGLRDYFDRRQHLPIRNANDAVNVIIQYFSKARAAQITAQPNLPLAGQPRPDVTLTFGPYRVVIEAKFAQQRAIEQVISEALSQLRSLLLKLEATIGAVVIFYTGDLSDMYKDIRVLDEGRLYVLVIRL